MRVFSRIAVLGWSALVVLGGTNFTVALLLFAPIADAAPQVLRPNAVTYSYIYPPQPGRSELEKCDPKCALLTNGKFSTIGPGAVWGGWGVKPFAVDWTFSRPVRVRAIRVGIVHPFPLSKKSHPGSVELFADGPGGHILGKPELQLPITFQTGKLEKITLPIPGKGLLVRHLCTQFDSAQYQTVLDQVSFVTAPASRKQLDIARVKRIESHSSKPLKRVYFLPEAMPHMYRPAIGSIFGADGHMIQSDLFYPHYFSRYWRLGYILPFVQRLGVNWMREPLYQSFFEGKKGNPTGPNKTNRAACRRIVEQYLRRYDAAGVRVLLCSMFSKAGQPGFARYFRWLGKLAEGNSCVAGIELGNEPNLHGFWRYSIREYVRAARRGAGIVRTVDAKVPIIVGAFNGWGYGGDHPKLKAEAKDGASLATIWARKAFADGLLSFANGVSAHPYRCSSAPEGGNGIESPSDPSGFQKEIRDFWNLVQRYNIKHRRLGLYFTELGYSSFTSGYSSVGTASRQANYLSRLMLILFNTRLAGIPLKAVCWYDIKQGNRAVVGGYESHFGLVSENTSHVTPAYMVYQRIIHAFGDTGDFRPINLNVKFSNLPTVIKYFTWKRKSDGAIIITFWRMNQLQTASNSPDKNFDSELSLKLPKGVGLPVRVVLHDLRDYATHPIGFRVDGAVLKVPLYVTDRAAWLVIHIPPAR